MSDQLELFRDQKKQWEKEADSVPQRDYDFRTLSGDPVQRLYVPDPPAEDYLEIRFPGAISVYPWCSFHHV